jgi:predicted permease
MTALTLLSLLLFGLVPAFQGAGGSLQDSLRSLGRTATGTVAVRRLRRALVGAEFALATPLLVVAVLLLASLNELQRVDLGFDTRNLLTGSVRLPTAQYGEPGRVTSFWNELEQRLQAVPSVAGVAFADGRPPNGVGNINNFDLELAPTPAGQSQPATPWVAVSPGYFAVMGLERVEGRLLEQSDALRENLETVVVDRAWARRFFPNASAVGKRFREGGCTDCPWTTVVGVVSEVKYMGLDQPDEGTVYWPLAPNSLTRFVLLRAGADPATVRQGVEHTVRALEPAAPFTNAATIDELVADSLDRPKWLMRLVASFALISLTLSLVGIYGVMGYYVQQHLKEISIRLALGATPAGVLRLVVGKGMAVVTGGMALGLLGAVGVTHTMSSLLFGVSPLSPLAFAAVTLMLLASALLACLLPARLAVRLEPAAVLRQD